MTNNIPVRHIPPLLITPNSKIGEILEKHPQLEDLLIQLVPSFGKLKNPILRKTIGRIATVSQAAEIGKISLGTLINQMRAAVGQERWEETNQKQETFIEIKPDWLRKGMITRTIDARPILERGEHPVQLVMSELENLQKFQILELITSFAPSPLVGLAETKKFKSWTLEESTELFRTYFSR